MEIWKPIIWYEWLYEVSNLGRIKSLNYRRSNKENILKLIRIDNVYLRIWLYLKSERNLFLVSRLVAIHFIPNPNNLPLVCHKKEDLDENWLLYNWANNLFWWNNSDNIKDMYSKCRSKSHFIYNHPFKWKLWKNNHCSVKIKQFSKNLEFIKTWDSIIDVERELWIYSSWISRCCKWHIKSSGGFIWKYL